jgi:hypothetical protein
MPASPGVRKVREETTRRARLAAILLVPLVGCAGTSLTPHAVPPSDVGGLAPATTSIVTAEDVAAEARDASVLSGILNFAGFQAGVRRSYVGGGPAIRRVDVRIFNFESSDGASIYLQWLRAHVTDLIGDVRDPSKKLFGGDVPLYVHVPDACCPREPAVALAAWGQGPQVVRVLIAGASADGRRAIRLVRDVRASTLATPDA